MVKLLSGIKSMYVDSLACIRFKWSEIERFKIYSGVRQGCVMSSWLFEVYMDALVKDVKMRMGRRGGGERERERERERV